MESTAKAYGKILVFGAYSVLEPGNIGWVVNIDKGTTTTVQETKEGRLVIDLANFQISVYGVVQGSKLKLEKNPEIIKYTKNAVEFALRYLNYKGVKIKDIRLISANDPELSVKNKKTGFGTSASSTVSTVAAVLKLHDIDDRNLVYRISQYSHYKSQGNTGSGFDILSSCYGSNFFITQPWEDIDFIKTIEKDYVIMKEEFEWPHYLLPTLIFTGKSASTKDLVTKVLEFKARNPQAYQRFISEYDRNNITLRASIEQSELKVIKPLLEKSWNMRKQLGRFANVKIEEEDLTRLINDLMNNGAWTAGLIGAGGGDSILAISLSDRDRKNLLIFCKKKRLTVLDNINIANKGYEILT
jgi:ERG8-type phosphomevalonate kinase